MKTKYYLFIGGMTLLLLGLYACTKLDNKDYQTIVASQFNPGPGDIAALVGVPYTNWRTLELGRSANAIWRTNEISADETGIPERPNGWVDGGIYRRMHTHTWTPDEDNCFQIWTKNTKRKKQQKHRSFPPRR